MPFEMDIHMDVYCCIVYWHNNGWILLLFVCLSLSYWSRLRQKDLLFSSAVKVQWSFPQMCSLACPTMVQCKDTFCSFDVTVPSAVRSNTYHILTGSRTYFTTWDCVPCLFALTTRQAPFWQLFASLCQTTRTHGSVCVCWLPAMWLAHCDCCHCCHCRGTRALTWPLWSHTTHKHRGNSVFHKKMHLVPCNVNIGCLFRTL